MSINNNNYCKLAQYCAASIKKCKDKNLDYVIFSNVGNRIFDTLDDINYKLPLEIPFRNKWLKDFIAGGSTALHLALRYVHYDDVESLIKRGADFTIKNGNGQTVLHRALLDTDYLQRDEVVTDLFIHMLLSAHIDYNILENPIDEHGLSHFHIACMSNQVKAVEFFLKNRVSVDEAIGKDSKILPGYSPLHIAVRYSALETVQALLEHGANVSQKDDKGITALHIVVEYNTKLASCLDIEKPEKYKKLKSDIEKNEKIIGMLLSGNGNNDCTNLSPLQIACTMQDPSRARQLLENNADLEYSVSKNSVMWPGYTALHFAARFNIDTVKLLLEKGANILAKNANNMTPLDFCIEKFSIEDICSLINSQQNLSDITFSDKKTKLLCFIFTIRNKNTFKYFMQKISDINIYIPHDSPLWPGYTLLHLTISFVKGDDEILNSLVNDNDYCLSDDERQLDSDEDESTSREKLSKRIEMENDMNLENIKICLEKGTDVTAQDIHGQTPLHLAFSNNKNNNVIDLLSKNHLKTTNPVDAEGLSHLHIAVAFGMIALMKKLLKADKSDVNKPVNYSFNLNVDVYSFDDKCTKSKKLHINSGSTALHIAIARRDYQMAIILIKFGADMYARDEYDLTPIHMIISYSIDEICDFKDILDDIDNLKNCVVESVGLNYLHIAVCLQNEKIVKDLLNEGVNIESKITANDSLPFLKEYDKMGPLQLAFKYMCGPSIVRLLIEHGAEIPACEPIDLGSGDSADFLSQVMESETLRRRLESEIGVSLLHFACASLDLKVAQEELNKGADVNARTHVNSPFWPGCTPLHLVVNALMLNHKLLEPLVKLLLSHGAEVTLTDVRRETPIHQFYSRIQSNAIDNPYIVDWMLEAQKDFNVNPADGLGFSHFHIACVRDCERVVKQFLDHGVDYNCQINYFDLQYDGGSSPLYLTVNYEAEKSCNLLLEYGADLNLADRLGNTPLHCAIEKYPTRFELFQRLISAGADVMAKNVFGITPVEMLLDLENTPNEIIELMLKGGVCTNSFNPVTEEGYLAIAFFAIHMDEKETRMNPSFEIMMAQEDLNVVDDMGRNAIYNLISRKRRRTKQQTLGCVRGMRSNSMENYTAAIDRLIRIGCNVDHQDKQGRTPLHIATRLQNYEAIIALFNCGANVNVVDEYEKPAIAYLLEYGESKNEVNKCMFMPYYLYMSSLSSYRFALSEANVKIYNKIRDIFQMLPIMMRIDYEEIGKLKEWKIGSSSMKLYDLLTEEGVKAYTMIKYDDRLVIDELFRSDRLRKEFPNSTSYLLLRYNQARVDLQTRLALIEPAKASLNCLGCCDVPEVCAHIIFGFLTGGDLQNLIASVFNCE